MIYRKYLFIEIVIFFLVVWLSPSCKSKTENSYPCPAILSVRITPENPKTTQDLNVIIEGLEGSNPAFKYCWKRNEKEIFGEAFKTLSHLNFSKHDTISVVVTPLQEGVVGKSVESDPAVVMNTEPIISSAIIKPQPSYTNSQLEVMVGASDEDDDCIVYSCQWIKNDRKIDNESSNVLSSSRFERGDSIKCRVIPSDREVEGKVFTTETIIIANSPPVITSQPPSEIVSDSLFIYEIAADDPDQDSILFSLSSSLPEGMIIDPATGVIEWKIPKGLTGDYPIEIMVSDGYGGRCSQVFNLSIGES